MGRKKTVEEFIEDAKKIHGSKYMYTKAKYVNNRSKVCIICPAHGEFWQIPDKHINSKQGCPICGGVGHYDNGTFIKKSVVIHLNKYDYSKVNYVNNYTKVCIICPHHGEFWQTPKHHLNGHGCIECSKKIISSKLRSNKNEVIKKFRGVHNDRYDYSKVNYGGDGVKVCIICPYHGEFWQTPHSHLSGCGCPQCNGGILQTKEEFIKKACLTHGDNFDYSKVKYINSITKVCIVCSNHGDFLQTPANHLSGQGCPKCNSSHLENIIRCLLKENNIEVIEQASKKDLPWLGRLKLDFYLPDYNMAIECQGEQHFRSIPYFGGESKFQKTIQRDKIKFKKCKINNITLLYYSNLGISYPYKVYEDKEELLKEIYGREQD